MVLCIAVGYLVGVNKGQTYAKAPKEELFVPRPRPTVDFRSPYTGKPNNSDDGEPMVESLQDIKKNGLYIPQRGVKADFEKRGYKL